jgi:hypothetical protein
MKHHVIVTVRFRISLPPQFTQSFQLHCAPEVDLASNRNKYQKSSWGVKHGWLMWLTTSPSSMSKLSRKCSLNISQLYGPSQPVTGIVLCLLQDVPLPLIPEVPSLLQHSGNHQNQQLLYADLHL